MLVSEAIASVLAQTFDNFELLVVDDASTDDTAERLAILADQDARIRILRAPSPIGAAAARNLALAEARGTWCTGLDDDDLMLPNRLAGLYAARTDRYALICTSFWLERDGVRRLRHHGERIITLDHLLHYNLVGNQALMRTDRVRAIGGFDADLPASQDYDLWTRMLERYGPARRLAEPSYVMRDHGEQLARISNSSAASKGAERYRQKHALLMSPAHERSQRLIATIIAHEPLTLQRLWTCVSPGSLPLLLRYAGVRLKSRWRKIRLQNRWP